MRQLLDTHTLIWYINGDEQLSENARKAIDQPDSVNFISIASLWEIAIKLSLGKLQLLSTYPEMYAQINDNNFEILPITFEDTLHLSTLSLHHRDPFDRMIIAQGITNKLTIISKDSHFSSYEVSILW